MKNEVDAKHEIDVTFRFFSNDAVTSFSLRFRITAIAAAVGTDK